MNPELRLLEEYDLRMLAHRLGLVNDAPVLDSRDLAKALNEAERLSIRFQEDTSRIALTICGLAWEHFGDEFHSLTPFLTMILARLGLMPSTKMVDPENRMADEFAGLGSLFSELQVMRRFIENSVRIGVSGEIELSEFQKKMWVEMGEAQRLGVSAPTSAGKSFVLLHRALDILNSRESGTVLIVVPTIALINQYTTDLKRAIKQYGLQGFEVGQSYSATLPLNRKKIYVLTQERALSAISLNPNAFDALELFIVDEIQNIERATADEDDSGDERSQDLLQLILAVESNLKPERIVLCGPRITNIDALVKRLLGGDARSITVGLPPVVNLTYAFSRVEGSGVVMKLYDGMGEQPIMIDVQNDGIFKAELSQKPAYSDPSYNLLAHFASKFKSDGQVLIFSPTKLEAQKSALKVANLIPKGSEALSSLGEYLQNTIHPSYILSECVASGVGYHHATVPKHARYALEKCFSEGKLEILFCTTTLLQGVNLPAKYLIARNPHQEVRRSKKDEDLRGISGFEFANLRGRAGRLLKDFVGRAIVLDEKSFDDEGVDISKHEGQEVGTDFKARFERSREQIFDVLRSNKPITKELPNSDLVAYIRTTARTNPDQFRDKLLRIGIDMEEIEAKAIVENMANLKVGADVCRRNPHWDPLVLELLLEKYQEELRLNPDWKIPQTPFDQRFIANLKIALTIVDTAAPFYFKKYLPTIKKPRSPLYLDENKVLRLAFLWGTEASLDKIIGEFWNEKLDAGSIEGILKVLSDVVPFDLPKVLRPLITIDDPENSLLSWMEIGAYQKLTKSFMERGLGREPAIRIVAKISDLGDFGGYEIDEMEHSIIAEAAREMNEWDRRQIEEYILE
jgi:hypothetical protein